MTRVGSENAWVREQLAWGALAQLVAILRVFNSSLALLRMWDPSTSVSRLYFLLSGEKKRWQPGGRAKAPATKTRGRLGAQRAVPASPGRACSCVRGSMEPEVKVREGGTACTSGTTRVACSRWRRALGRRW